jgi:hypothetical protein
MMVISVFDPLSISVSDASSCLLSPTKPPVPAFVIMSTASLGTASSLSLPSSCVAGHVVNNGSPPEPGSVLAEAIEVDETSVLLPSVWDLDHVLKTGDCKANQTWKCLWCNMVFKQWNATKVLYHLSKKTGHDVRVCKAAHDLTHRELYRRMLEDKDKSHATHQARVAQFESMVGEGQQSLAVMFEAGRKRVTNGGGGGTVSTGTTTNAAAATVNNGRTRVYAAELTVEASTSSQLTMAIADFVHSSGLPFSATQGVYFLNILKFARGVPFNYKPPNRNAIADSLLKINYNRRMEK